MSQKNHRVLFAVFQRGDSTDNQVTTWLSHTWAHTAKCSNILVVQCIVIMLTAICAVYEPLTERSYVY